MHFLIDAQVLSQPLRGLVFLQGRAHDTTNATLSCDFTCLQRAA